MSKYKVVFHIDEMNKWKLVLANVSNLLAEVDIEEFDVVVLANSEAVKYYDMTQTLETGINKMKELGLKGVRFVACNNSLKTNKIAVNDIFHFVHIVPVGVLELVIKQSEGYAYIKP